MSRQVQRRRDTGADIAANTPADGEIWVNNETDRPHVGDGVTQGGHPLALLTDLRLSDPIAADLVGTNTLTVTLDPAPVLADIKKYHVIHGKAGGTNTGPVTINPNGLGAVPVLDNEGAELLPGRQQTGGIYTYMHDGAGSYRLITGLSRSAGAWETVERQSVSNVADVQFTAGLVAGFEYEISCSNLRPVTDSTVLEMQCSSTGGPPYEAGATDYEYASITGVSGGGASGFQTSVGDTKVPISGPMGNNPAGGERSILMMRFGDPSPALNHYFSWVSAGGSTTPRLVTTWGSAVFDNGGTLVSLTAIKLAFATGNISVADFVLSRRALV